MELRIVENLEEENIRLKKKINQLIDLIVEGKIIDEKSKYEETKNLVEEGQDNSDYVFNILKNLFQKIDEDKLLIPHKKGSKNAKDFYKIDDLDFARILKENANKSDKKIQAEIYEFIAATGMIKLQANGKIFWSDFHDGKSTKIILVKKSAFKYFLKVRGANHENRS